MACPTPCYGRICLNLCIAFPGALPHRAPSRFVMVVGVRIPSAAPPYKQQQHLFPPDSVGGSSCHAVPRDKIPCRGSSGGAGPVGCAPLVFFTRLSRSSALFDLPLPPLVVISVALVGYDFAQSPPLLRVQCFRCPPQSV